MFEQMTVDCAKEGSLGQPKLDNKSTAKGLLPSLLEDLERLNTAKVRGQYATTLDISSFIFKASENGNAKGLRHDCHYLTLATQESG